ncbi:MAG: pyridoxal phosphate-dependent aminotransferase family protein, partial [Spirochaetota bacterium]
MYEPQTVLQKLREERQYRSLETFPRSGAKFAGPDEGQILSFCSNDYLNLSRHPELTNAALYAIQHYGCGAGSSRLLSGHLEIHRELEERLASWSGAYEAALIFGSGYLANCGVLQAVLEPNARVLFDRLNHASLVDGLRLASGLRASSLHWERYRHGDMADLERRLKRLVTEGEQPIWVISDSVFSMDGDTAPLHRLAELSDKYRFRWIVDEAHAVGIYGPTGAGLVQELALEVCAGNTPPLRLPDFVTANFAKALGSYGGYCLCSGEWKEYLVNFSRSLIYSTGLPPASAAAA